MTNTRKLIGAAAFSLALAGGGVAGILLGSPVTSGAQEPTTTTADESGDTAVHVERRGPGLDAAATALGMTVEELETELEAGKTIAEVATAQGVDVETVIDAMVAEATDGIRERVTAIVNGEAPLGGRHGHRGFGAKLETLTTVLGVTAEELHDALESGQSIADVAAAEGVDVQTVIDALVEAGVPAERAQEIVDHEGTFERHHRGPRP